MKKNYIALVLDNSGSMNTFKHKAVEVFNRTLNTIKEQAKKTKQKTYITLITFNNNVVCRQVNVDSQDTPELVSYLPQGGTALIDAVCKAKDVLSQVKVNKREDVSFLVMTITDGCENSSLYYNAKMLSNEIIRLQNTDRWTFTFQVPKGYDQYIADLGVSKGNIQTWETTEDGLETTFVSNNLGLTNYYNARHLGKMSTPSFYTDLSNVNTNILEKKLNDVSLQFKSYNVSNEDVIKDFVESKTKKPYELGIAYYQLMKKELVQSNKEILVQDKKSKHIYAGESARNLIGIPTNQNVKVEPGNHSNYEIFIQSNSVNRKLPRGTKVLIKKV